MFIVFLILWEFQACRGTSTEVKLLQWSPTTYEQFIHFIVTAVTKQCDSCGWITITFFLNICPKLCVMLANSHRINISVCHWLMKTSFLWQNLFHIIVCHLISVAAVNKLIKEMIPNVRVSNDARELILNCCTGIVSNKYNTMTIKCKYFNWILSTFGPTLYYNPLLSEFIHLVSSEANEVCKQRAKKTIAPEHIIDALKVIIRLAWSFNLVLLFSTTIVHVLLMYCIFSPAEFRFYIVCSRCSVSLHRL